MRKFLGVGFFVAALVFSGHFAIAGPSLTGDLISTSDVDDLSNNANGNGSISEVQVGSIIGEDTVVVGDVITTVDAEAVSNLADGNGSEASVTLGGVGE